MASLKETTRKDITGSGNRLYVTHLGIVRARSKDDDRGLHYPDNGKDYGSGYARKLADVKRGFRR